MDTRGRYKFELFEGGKDEFEKTRDFIAKTKAIREALSEQYSVTLSSEKNWFRRLLIKAKLEMEIRKQIQALSSLKNLHLARLVKI